MGGWIDYRELDITPEIDIWRRAQDAGFEFLFVPRLTAVKFPASTRRDVYRLKPCHEQAAWSARIASEPDLESTLLVQMIAQGRAAQRMNYRQLANQFFEDTVIRIRRRLGSPSKLFASLWPRKGAVIDRVRRFKGL